uniref:Uncharacterized protein n=1 Tax=Anguilla anguilla TaxID=7936 RepID=A0A0E9RLM1_ANGAN
MCKNNMKPVCKMNVFLHCIGVIMYCDKRIICRDHGF